MIRAGDPVIAAVSGGADSVCLLHVLREAQMNLSGVAHFNHKLRGEASDEDERFVGGAGWPAWICRFFALKARSEGPGIWSRRLGGPGGLL